MLNKGEHKHLNSEGLTIKTPCCICTVICASVQSSLELTEKKREKKKRKANKTLRIKIYFASSELTPTPRARGQAGVQGWDARGHAAAPQGVESCSATAPSGLTANSGDGISPEIKLSSN